MCYFQNAKKMLTVLVLTPETALVANAQTFDENSAGISNKYAPFSPGKPLISDQIQLLR